MNQNIKILIIGFVWPEPNSSAAGSRMMQLIELFQRQSWEVNFATTATETPHMVDLNELGVLIQKIHLNDDGFDEYVSVLKPDVVVFDRFIVEEQFGWRVADQCPSAIRVLDTEDLHSLRKTRQEAFKKGCEFTTDMLLTSEIAKRELASIYRCDLSLIISTYEMKLLQEVFNIDKSLLCYLPFLIEEVGEDKVANLPSYEDRAGFMCIGNFRHEPNWNMVLYLKQTIWPMIRKEFPKAELHVYGSYPSEKVTQLNSKSQGFLIKGWAKDVNLVMQKSRVCLAPIRFGAGIKGKFTDAMQNGLPCVTTSIGAEGMHDGYLWNGSVVNSPKEIVNSALELYQNKEVWLQAQNNGAVVINSIYASTTYQQNFIDVIYSIKRNIKEHRTSNFIGSMLLHHTLKSTMYLSKWIGEKERNK